MRAVELHHPDPEPAAALRAVERPDPVPGPGQVVVEVDACAVCRTDLQLATGDLPARRLPVIPGHQVVGRIGATGSGVDPGRIGQQVGLVWLARTCGSCAFCTTGRENLCRAALFTGWDVDGGWATHATADADHAHPIPDLGPHFPTGDAAAAAVAPLLCGGVIGYRSLRVAGVLPPPDGSSAGLRLGLFGFGASASLALQVARFLGVQCYVVTRSPGEVRRARDLGAAWAGTYEESLPTRLDAAITFAPVGSVVVAALQALERGGTVAVNAIHLDRIPSFDYDHLWWERSIRSVANVTRQDVREFLDLVPRAGIRTAFAELPLAAAADALRRLRDGDVAGAFVLRP